VYRLRQAAKRRRRKSGARNSADLDLRQMKIVGINDSPERTNEKQTAFFTEPALTEEVFDIYSQMVGEQNIFYCQNGLLIASRSFGIDKEYLDQTELYLSEAEKKIQGTQTRREKQHKERLEHISKTTGRAIGRWPHS
jgi:hypothetical protein